MPNNWTMVLAGGSYQSCGRSITCECSHSICQFSRGRHCDRPPISVETPRRAVHQFTLIEPVIDRKSSLLRTKTFLYCHDERRQLTLCHVYLVFVRRTVRHFKRAHEPYLLLRTAEKFAILVAGSQSRHPLRSQQAVPRLGSRRVASEDEVGLFGLLVAREARPHKRRVGWLAIGAEVSEPPSAGRSILF